jgi:hypothetical protein
VIIPADLIEAWTITSEYSYVLPSGLALALSSEGS